MRRTADIGSEISVVVPTLGGPILDDCLDSIAAGSVWPARLIIVEQGVGAPSPTIAGLLDRGMNVLHVRMPRAGSG